MKGEWLEWMSMTTEKMYNLNFCLKGRISPNSERLKGISNSRNTIYKWREESTFEYPGYSPGLWILQDANDERYNKKEVSLVCGSWVALQEIFAYSIQHIIMWMEDHQIYFNERITTTYPYFVKKFQKMRYKKRIQRVQECGFTRIKKKRDWCNFFLYYSL